MTIAITNVALTSNVATITTSTAHGIPATWDNGSVVIGIDALSNTVFNGVWVVTGVTSTTISFTLTHVNILSTSDSGIVIPYTAVNNQKINLRTSALKNTTTIPSPARFLIDDPAKAGSEGCSLATLAGLLTPLPTNIVYTSKAGLVANASSTINADASGWTDNRVAIQTLFDKAKTAPTWIIFDGGMYGTTGNTVDVSNYSLRITFLQGCGLNGMPGGSSVTSTTLGSGDLLLGHGLISNANQVDGLGSITDNKGLIIEGGSIIGGRHRPSGTGWSGGTGSLPLGRSLTGDGDLTHVGCQISMGMCSFYGIENLIIRNMTIKDSAGYNIHIASGKNVLVEGCDIESIDEGVDYMDGVHFNGPCTNIRVNDNRVSVPNDAIAFNADDGNNSGWALIFGPKVTRGDITYGNCNNNFVDGSLGCCRVLSATSLIDQVFFDGFYGTTTQIIAFAQNDAIDTFPPTGNGNFGTWGISNCSVVCAGANYKQAYYISGTHKHIILRNIRLSPNANFVGSAYIDIGFDYQGRAAPTNITELDIDGLYGDDASHIEFPIIRFSGNSGNNTLDTLKVNNLRQLSTAGGSVARPAFQLLGGTVNNIVIEGYVIESTDSVIDLQGGTVGSVILDGIHCGDNLTPYGTVKTAISIPQLYLGKPGPMGITGAGGAVLVGGAGSRVFGKVGQTAARFGTISLWPLESVADAYGSNTLTNNNTVTFTSGKIGNAATLVAVSSQSLSVVSNSGLRAGNVDYLVAAWVKMASKASSGNLNTIMAKCNLGGSTAIEVLLYYNGTPDRLEFNVGNGASTGASPAVANNLGSPSTGVWYLVIGWIDVANNRLGININNGTDNTTTLSLTPGSSARPLYIGALEASLGTPGSFFDGQIDSVAIMKPATAIAALLPEIKFRLYNGGTGCGFAK